MQDGGRTCAGSQIFHIFFIVFSPFSHRLVNSAGYSISVQRKRTQKRLGTQKGEIALNKKWFLLSAVAVMLAGSLVACSSGGDSPEPATESGGNVSEPATSSDVGTSSDTSTDSTVTDDAGTDSDTASDSSATDSTSGDSSDTTTDSADSGDSGADASSSSNTADSANAAGESSN